MGGMSASQITQEMQKVEQALVNLVGKRPAYMRPPYLETGGQFLPTLKGLGYKVITDDVDAGDWNNKSPAQSQQTFQQAGAKGNGHIPVSAAEPIRGMVANMFAAHARGLSRGELTMSPTCWRPTADMSQTVQTLTPWLINWAKTNNLKIVTVGEYSPSILAGDGANPRSRVPGRRRGCVPDGQHDGEQPEQVLDAAPSQRQSITKHEHVNR
jgi:peptidoglycan/xylan/chitin deacetylase (PgdA/CDA1 family)